MVSHFQILLRLSSKPFRVRHGCLSTLSNAACTERSYYILIGYLASKTFWHMTMPHMLLVSLKINLEQLPHNAAASENSLKYGRHGNRERQEKGPTVKTSTAGKARALVHTHNVGMQHKMRF